MKRYERMLGSLLGAAAGDAMGAATEIRTRKQIEEKFGGYVTTFLPPPEDTFARGNAPGEVTDDFSIAWYTCREIIQNGGVVTTEVAKKAVLEWGQVEKYFTRFAGPTTRAAILRMRGEEVPLPDNFKPVNENAQASNGAAMKAAPLALFAGGDIDKAIANVMCTCLVTHPNNNALAGAGAIAAATAAALQPGAHLYSVVQAGLYGAREGNRIGLEKAHPVAACSVEKKMKLAIGIGLCAPDLSSAIDELNDVVGAGLAAAEAVPTAFGLMVAAGGDAVRAIEAAVNIGNDTDTIAIMVGGVLGALQGAGALPGDWLSVIDKANGYDLAAMAKQIDELAP